MGKKSVLEKAINRKVGGMKRSAKSKIGLRKNNKGCVVLLFCLMFSFLSLVFIII